MCVCVDVRSGRDSSGAQTPGTAKSGGRVGMLRGAHDAVCSGMSFGAEAVHSERLEVGVVLFLLWWLERVWKQFFLIYIWVLCGYVLLLVK